MSIGKIKKAVAKIVAITALVSSVMTIVGFAQVSETNDNKYIINSVTMNNRDVEYSRVPSKGNFYVNIYFEASESEFVPATALVAAYSEDGKLVSVNYEEITEDINLDGRCSVYIGACSTAISAVKIFIWNSIDGMKPLSESFSIVNEPLKEYGVVVGMYTIAGDEYPTVRIITADGEIEAYEAKSVKVAEAIAKSVGQDSTEFGKDDVDFVNSVIEYKIVNNKITFWNDENLDACNALTPVGGQSMEHNADALTLGEYRINSETTQLINLKNYVEDNEANDITVDSLVDGIEYEAYVYAQNADGDYEFVVILGNEDIIKSESKLAVVSGIGDTKTVNGVDCTTVEVIEGGVESVEIFIEGEVSFAEGEIISYLVNDNGYISQTEYGSLLKPDSNYTTMLNTAITGFSANIDNVTYNEDRNVYEIDIDKEGINVKARASFGPVYRKSGNTLDMFQAGDDTSNVVTDIKTFNVANANSVVYDYSAKSGYRVSVGSASQPKSRYSVAIDEDDVIWADVIDNEVEPVMAFVKTVDGIVTDVIYYTTG